MQLITLDFETYYDTGFSLKEKLWTTSSYVRNHRFEALCVALKRDDKDVEAYYGPDIQRVFNDIDWSNTAVLAHNTAFDGFILHHRYGIHPAYYLDTLSMGRALHGHRIGVSLDSLAAHLGYGGKIQNTLAGLRGKRLDDLNDTEKRDMVVYCAHDVQLCWQLFQRMAPSFIQSELDLIDLTIRLFCQPKVYVDMGAVKAELCREISSKSTRIADGGVPIEVLNSAQKFATYLEELGVDVPTKISKKTGKKTYALSKSDEEFTELLDSDIPGVAAAVEARLAAKSTIGETRPARFLREGKNGWPLPVGLNYYGANTTGRWSGGNKQNLQNLPRGGALRRAIKAPPGKVVVVADSGQIECRVNGWLAQQEDLIDAFRNKKDPYCALASRVYGRTITKADPLERQVGKTAVLGLGYQMGAPRFQAALKLGKPPVNLPASICADTVTIYRDVNNKIVEQWATCEEILVRLFRGAKGTYRCLEYGDSGITLPNGMRIKYDDLKAGWVSDFSAGKFTYTGKRDARISIYGGKVVENVVQALSRIIISTQMLEIAKYLDVVTMTHDEIVCLADEADGEDALKFMIEAMSTPPDWCSDIPLAAEGGFDIVYSK